MGFLSFLKTGNKPTVQEALAVLQKTGADINKTQRVKELLQMPAYKRDENWRRAFYEYVQTASFECGDPQIMTGPDGFPFFVLKTPAADQSFEPVCIQSLANEILDKGYGIVINPTDDTADWVFSYGDMVNLHLNNEFVSDTDNVDVKNIEMTKKVEVLKKGEDVMLAQPSVKYLPQQARQALKKFLQSKGFKKPMVMMMCRKSSGKMIQELAFNVLPEDFSSPEERDYCMQQIGWFLPRHYLIVSFQDHSGMTRHFADL
jgi:hypothetical protein